MGFIKYGGVFFWEKKIRTLILPSTHPTAPHCEVPKYRYVLMDLSGSDEAREKELTMVTPEGKHTQEGKDPNLDASSSTHVCLGGKDHRMCKLKKEIL